MSTVSIPLSSASVTFPEVILETNLKPKSHSEKTSSNQIGFLIATLVCLQIIDGILTSIGVYNFGENIEGNELIRTLMNQVGYLNALLLIKLGAIGLVLSLYPLSRYVSWMKGALKLVNLIYFCAAILPWSAIMMDYYS